MKKETAHPQVVTHGDSFTWSHLEFPLQMYVIIINVFVIASQRRLIWKRSIRWISMFVVHIQTCLILRSEITQIKPSWPISTYWYHCFLGALPAIPSPTITFIKRDLFQHRLTNQHSQRPTTQSSIKPSTCSIILYGRLKEVTNCHCIDIEDVRPGGEVLSLTHPTNQLAAPSSPHPSHPP